MYVRKDKVRLYIPNYHKFIHIKTIKQFDTYKMIELPFECFAHQYEKAPYIRVTTNHRTYTQLIIINGNPRTRIVRYNGRLTKNTIKRILQEYTDTLILHSFQQLLE